MSVNIKEKITKLKEEKNAVILAHFVAEQVPEKNFIFNKGYCPVHEELSIRELLKVKEEHQPCDCSWRRLYFQRSTDTFSSYIGHFPKESACYRIKNDSLRVIFF